MDIKGGVREKMEKSEIIYRISVGSLAIIIILGALNYFSCHVETYCDVQINGKIVGEMDCNIIYGRLGGPSNIPTIENMACSDEVIGIVREQFGFGNITECHYYCCVTDGTCYGFPPRGVNIQMLDLRE